MKKYEILEHKADLKIKVFGNTKEELFLNALLAMIDSMNPEIKNRDIETNRSVKIESLDLSSLLVDFLSEVLYLSQINSEAYFKVKFSKFVDTELEGEISGNKAERFGEDIKAVTFHDLNIILSENKTWEATIIFDI